MYSNSGPPQPEWRLPPRPPTTATGTTTATTATSTPSTSPVPPPHPPAPSAPAIPSYNPNAFGPMPGVPPVATGIDTTAWGVKFNQHQHHQAHSPPPPLPVSASHGLTRTIPDSHADRMLPSLVLPLQQTMSRRASSLRESALRRRTNPCLLSPRMEAK